MNSKLIRSLLLLMLTLTGCEEQVDYGKEESLNFDADKDLQGALQQNRMPLLAVRLGCNNCHALNHKLVGPAWKEIGRRYRNAVTFEYQGKSYPVAEGLVAKISRGGGGNWGVEPMPAADPNGSNHARLGKLVGFILELGKQ